SLGIVLAADPASFNNEKLFTAFVLCMVTATSCGFFSITIFAFTSAKVRRLLGRTFAVFGDENVTFEQLMKFKCTRDAMNNAKLLSEYVRNLTTGPRFYARHWYYGGGDKMEPGAPTRCIRCPNPSELIDSALNSFIAMLLLFCA